MAHHVVTKKVPYVTGDGRTVKGKYMYTVKCKRCGSLHPNKKITSEGIAKLYGANHYVEVHDRHHRNHPADRAHQRTDRQKQEKMVKPRG